MECCRGGLLPHSTGLGCVLPDGEEDRISALTDDILLQILARIGCARAAAHTSLLARRWRGLWAHLPAFTFHHIAPGSLDAALALVARPAPSLLDLPCFDRTVSIKLDLYFVRFTLPPAGGFLALESLHLENGCIDLSDLLPRCPRLRKLLIPFWNSQSIVVRSPSLEEFSVHANFNIAQLEIVAPALKRLYMDAYRGIHDDCNVVFAAPAVKDLTWKCECKALTYMFGVIWRMWSLTFEYTQLDNNIDSQSVCLQSQHRPFVGVLSLSLETNVLPGDVSKTFEQEIYRFQVTDCSVLELDLIQQGHVYGTIVLHLLGLCTSIQRLKVTLDEFLREDSCYANCWCDQPNNWRSQSISLIDLKEVEIYRFRGQDHEVDLLKVLLRCATVLERVTLGFSRKVSSSDSACMKIVGILEDYPSVKCNFYQYGKLIFMRE
ncbi:hypothetical protein SORBI_3002G304801 [Sorghum bicolor]|uniref:FBD domain-containing protein n=1 Tax=Sorghum bicolor TaxID=4558 RepID=A0A1B6QE89_SORBI|nr:hypothetical protein SORBI_3002G304801 [Sorghum bicolor]